MKKILLFLLIIVIFIFAANLFAQDETITLTAYYPAPYGVYQIVQLYPINQPAFCQQGQMYYDSGTKGPYYCDDTGWKPFGNYWVLDRTTEPTKPVLYTKDADLGENWRLGIGNTQPPFKLTLGKVQVINGGILATGIDGDSSPTDIWPDFSLAANWGPYLIWYPEKAAFRVGYKGDYNPGENRWDLQHIGVNSIAMGREAAASGVGSTAIGGEYNYAKGTWSLALGRYSEALSEASISIGHLVTSTATNAIIMGAGNTGPGSYALVNNIGNSLMVGFGSDIPTLFVGPSSGAGTTGRVGIGTASPENWLHVAVDGNSTVQAVRISNYNTGASAGMRPILFVRRNAANNTDLEWFYEVTTGDTPELQLWRVNRPSVGPVTWVNPVSFTYDGTTYFNGGGNVGIGTTSPGAYQLYVDGTLAVTGVADKTGGGSWGTLSDSRLKDIIGEFNYGLDKIIELKPVRYHYKKDNYVGADSSKEHIGIVAQDAQKVIPEAVRENDRGYLILDSDPIIWAMLNSIKELNTENDAMRKRIEALEASAK